MTFFVANAACAFEDTRIGAGRLRVATECISTRPSGKIAGSPLFATVEAFSIITTAFGSGRALTSHMSRFSTAALCRR